MKMKWLKIPLFIIAIFIAVTMPIWKTTVVYLYCLSREDSWMKAKTEAELEKRLVAFYSKDSITPQKSIYGGRHVMQPGQRMTQYLIFWDAPLDVVYAADGKIDAIYRSYE
ncbi:MAG: hypothetical protein QM680_08980 [Luteolibacter sp.]